jgi:hypothetical protein
MNYRANYLLKVPEDMTRIFSTRRALRLEDPKVPEYSPDYQEPDDDMSVLATGEYSRELPEKGWDRERPPPERERDRTDWYNRYDEPETQLPPEYPFHEFNYGP